MKIRPCGLCTCPSRPTKSSTFEIGSTTSFIVHGSGDEKRYRCDIRPLERNSNSICLRKYTIATNASVLSLPVVRNNVPNNTRYSSFVIISSPAKFRSLRFVCYRSLPVVRYSSFQRVPTLNRCRRARVYGLKPTPSDGSSLLIRPRFTTASA